MEVFSQVCPFFVSVLDAEEWRYPLHRHTHYELIYILHGAGTHHLNEQQYPYQADDIFLCSPRDAHRFAITEPTRFCLIKLNLSFLLAANDTFALVQPLFETDEASAPFAFDAAIRAYLRSQVEFCMREFAQRQFLYAHTIHASVLSILVLLVKSLRQLITWCPPSFTTCTRTCASPPRWLWTHWRRISISAPVTSASTFGATRGKR